MHRKSKLKYSDLVEKGVLNRNIIIASTANPVKGEFKILHAVIDFGRNGARVFYRVTRKKDRYPKDVYTSDCIKIAIKKYNEI